METRKLSIDFPAEEFVYLKMACAKMKMSMKDFVAQSVIRSIEDIEDEYDNQSIETAKKDMAAHPQNLMEWVEFEKLIGWDKL